MAPESRNKVREGSPWRGLGAVITKEMADNLTSARMRILEILVVLTAVGTGYSALQQLSSSTGSTTSPDQFLFLKLFTTARDPLPAFAGFLGFLVPLVAISLAFDSVNGEFNRRTISRMLSQPIYRDALLLGKFLGGLFTLALVLSAIWLLVFGIGLLGLGVPPTGQEVARSLLFLLATIVYGGFWMALAMLFSTLFNQAATAALASIAVWLFFTVFWGILASLLAQTLKPIQYGFLDESLGPGKTAIGVKSHFSQYPLYRNNHRLAESGSAFPGIVPSHRVTGRSFRCTVTGRTKPTDHLAESHRHDRGYYFAVCLELYLFPTQGNSHLSL